MQINKNNINENISGTHIACLLEYHHKDRYSFLYILTKFHTKIIKNKQDTAKSLA